MNKKSNIRLIKRVRKSIVCLGILILMTGVAGMSGCGKGGNKDGNRATSLEADAVYDSSPEDSQLDTILQNLTENNILKEKWQK